MWPEKKWIVLKAGIKSRSVSGSTDRRRNASGGPGPQSEVPVEAYPEDEPTSTDLSSKTTGLAGGFLLSNPGMNYLPSGGLSSSIIEPFCVEDEEKVGADPGVGPFRMVAR